MNHLLDYIARHNLEGYVGGFLGAVIGIATVIVAIILFNLN